MKFYYTGGKVLNDWQPDAEKSLGNFISENEIGNGSLSNIFSDISLLGQSRELVEIKAIALKNTLLVPVTNVYLYFTYPVIDKNAKLEVGKEVFVSGKIGTIPNSRSLPYGVTFSESSAIGTKILLASSLAVGEAIGVWLRRTILPAPVNSVEKENLEAYLLAQTKVENIVISIEYT